MELHEIKKLHQEKMSQLMDECRVFWAFSTEQYQKNKTPLEEGEKYVRMDGGGFIPRNSVTKFTQGMKDLETWYKNTIKESKLRRQNIIYELGNHECWYTGDWTEAMGALGPDYTEEEVKKVFNEEYDKQIAARD
jgi:hypothetical protein